MGGRIEVVKGVRVWRVGCTGGVEVAVARSLGDGFEDVS